MADEASDSADEDGGGPKRKRSKPTGRIPSGQDFWGQVDLWFAKELNDRGKDFADVAWKM